MNSSSEEETGGPVERCVAGIVEAIRTGDLRPGHKLGEESFARKLKVDRSTVRLAFDRLVTAGLLERIHRSGTFVRRIDFQEYCQTAEVRAALEGLAGRLACQRAGDGELEALASQADRLDRFGLRAAGRALPAMMLELQVMEMDFHARLASLGGNPVLERILSFHHLINISFMSGIPGRASDPAQAPAVPQHTQIVAALKKRSPDDAEKVIRDHILLSKDAVIRQASHSYRA